MGKKLEKMYTKSSDVGKIIRDYYRDGNMELVAIYEKIIEFDKK